MSINSKNRKCYEAGIDAVKYIVDARKKKGNARYERLDEDKELPFIVSAVTWDSDLKIGSLNNEHWFFDVGYAFREALDLVFMERVRDKKKVNLWTQGPLIAFKEGDFIYSRCGKKSLQVKSATPMSWDEDKNDIHYGSVTYQENCIENACSKIKNSTQIEFLSILING